MSEVQRFWSHEASNIRCVREANFDRVTAERDALQQRLTAADERVDELEDLLRLTLKHCGYLTTRKRIEDALRPRHLIAE